MKFVYILTTDTNSSYFYQMYLSIQSLKKYGIIPSYANKK